MYVCDILGQHESEVPNICTVHGGIGGLGNQGEPKHLLSVAILFALHTSGVKEENKLVFSYLILIEV